ncbi:hypothetical protein KP509_13G044100 [Ceratopteris richardii]|uniref:Metallothionein n=1 Tax=Ceratopteris richardii TaxID=49495 RepID=A0A8T2TD57_CERRI|nr:hypothetical protein KP509_13G044100 [Ceratopteris richardii]
MVCTCNHTCTTGNPCGRCQAGTCGCGSDCRCGASSTMSREQPVRMTEKATCANVGQHVIVYLQGQPGTSCAVVLARLVLVMHAVLR